MKTIIKFLKSLFTKKCKHEGSLFLYDDWQERCTIEICINCGEKIYKDL